MLNFSIVVLGTHLSRVGHSVISKLEVVLVSDFSISIIEQLQQSFVAISRVFVRFESTIAHEIVAIDTVVSFRVRGESLEIHSHDFGLNLATKTRLLVVEGVESDSCAFVLPESLCY